MGGKTNTHLSKELNGWFYFYSVSEFHLRSGNETQPTGNNFISLFLKGPIHLLGMAIAGAEMMRERRTGGAWAAPRAKLNRHKAGGCLFFAFSWRCRRKRSRRVPPAGQTIKPIAPGKGTGKVSICDSVVFTCARQRETSSTGLTALLSIPSNSNSWV